jgi:penicillin-binding protein 1A
VAQSGVFSHISQWLSRFWQGLASWGNRHPWWTGLIAGGLFLLTLGLTFQQSVLWGAFGPLPSEEDLRHLKLPIASQVYSIDGKLLGRYFLEERDPLGPGELPQTFVETLIATEDVRFFSHQGSDWQSMLRVLFKTILLGDESAGGGSTLTQQLAKNLYPRQGHGLFPLLVHKIREIEIADRLEDLYSKDELLLWYLNTVSFGENAFGLKVASQRFFGKLPSDLKREEMAVLVGMLKAPTSYNPRLHPLASRQRRNVVLQQMVRYDYLWPQVADSLMALPLEIDYRRNTHHEGPAAYFREMLRQEMLLWCKQHPKWDGGHYNLYTDGLIIHTTLHSDLQQMAEEAVAEQMKRIQRNFSQDWRYARQGPVPESLVQQAKRQSPRYRSWQRQGYSEAEIDSLFSLPVPMRLFSWQEDSLRGISPIDSIRQLAEMLHCGLLALDPQSGHIRAWVGGINHGQFQFDHVSAARQSGSAFKPIVFATALEAGYSPCQYIANDKVSFARYGNWAPQNSDRSYGGEYSLQGALTHSVNIATVNLMMELQPAKVVEMSQRLGIERELPAVPSLALGTAEVSLLDLVPVYGTFVNGGKQIRPQFLLRVEDREGHLLYETSQQAAPQQVLSYETSAMMTHMLKNVVDQGTARGLRSRYGLKLDMAGKTGTTQAQADGWFVGATPGIAVRLSEKKSQTAPLRVERCSGEGGFGG